MKNTIIFIVAIAILAMVAPSIDHVYQTKEDTRVLTLAKLSGCTTDMECYEATGYNY